MKRTDESIISKLRDLAAELGMELIYMDGKSGTKFLKMTHENFSMKKYIGLARDGEVFLLPIHLDNMLFRLTRAVRRQHKKQYIERTQLTYGRSDI